jgi:mannose-1-phosphate guanylyltransferase
MGSEERASIILAGGEMRGLRSLARRIVGHDLPGQFSPVFGHTTMLERTERRVALAIPPERTLTVVTRAHERFYAPLLANVPPSRLVIQPRYRGTAPAVFYALQRSLQIAPDATVLICPSDQYVTDDAAFMRHVDLAFDAVKARPDLLVLLGVTPDGPSSDYDWIELGDRIAEYLLLFRISGFWEKPRPKLALSLWQQGCLWNSRVFVARLSALATLMAREFPELSRLFDGLASGLGSEGEREALQTIYTRIPRLDFSHEVLTRCPQDLATLPVCGVEWKELGAGKRRAIAMFRRARFSSSATPKNEQNGPEGESAGE